MDNQSKRSKARNGRGVVRNILMENAGALVVVSDDLIFSSRITGAARDRGATTRVVRTVDAAAAAAREVSGTCIIVDLALVAGQLPALVAELGAEPSRPRIVVYGSHVDAAGLRAATEAGCDHVLPRSKFVEALESDLLHWLAPRPKP
jgi:ActR/RegA family two-component response regulator